MGRKFFVLVASLAVGSGAMLFAAHLSHERKVAAVTLSVNNCKLWGVAILNYAAANGDRLPPHAGASYAISPYAMEGSREEAFLAAANSILDQDPTDISYAFDPWFGDGTRAIAEVVYPSNWISVVDAAALWLDPPMLICGTYDGEAHVSELDGSDLLKTDHNQWVSALCSSGRERGREEDSDE